MLNPSIDKLLTIVDSKYKLVHVAAIRAREMENSNYFQMKETEYTSERNIGRALEELEKGLIFVDEK